MYARCWRERCELEDRLKEALEIIEKYQEWFAMHPQITDEVAKKHLL